MTQLLPLHSHGVRSPDSKSPFFKTFLSNKINMLTSLENDVKNHMWWLFLSSLSLKYILPSGIGVVVVVVVVVVVDPKSMEGKFIEEHETQGDEEGEKINSKCYQLLLLMKMTSSCISDCVCVVQLDISTFIHVMISVQRETPVVLLFFTQ